MGCFHMPSWEEGIFAGEMSTAWLFWSVDTTYEDLQISTFSIKIHQGVEVKWVLPIVSIYIRIYLYWRSMCTCTCSVYNVVYVHIHYVVYTYTIPSLQVQFFFTTLSLQVPVWVNSFLPFGMRGPVRKVARSLWKDLEICHPKKWWSLIEFRLSV